MTPTEIGAILRPALEQGERITTIDVPFHEKVRSFQQDVYNWTRRYAKGATVAREKMGDGTYRMVILRREIAPAE